MRIDFVSFILRVAFGGILFVQHGITKLPHIAERLQNFADPLGIGSSWSFILTLFGEVVCSALLVLGIFTRFASAVLLFQMVVIVSMVLGFSSEFSKLELPILFAVGFSATLIAGGGRISLGHLLMGDKLSQL